MTLEYWVLTFCTCAFAWHPFVS